MTKTDISPPKVTGDVVALGKYLQAIRMGQDLTLRAVEEATKKEVSNAYLSQIENGRIKQPSPNVLNVLAGLYGVEYENLMRLAGYISASGPRRTNQRHGRAATFAELNLTTEEEEKLLSYLKFIRMESKNSGEE